MIPHDPEPAGSREPKRPKPVTPPPALDAIPGELKRRPQWVLWRWELNDKGEWTKVPYQATGTKAATDRRATWTTFARVAQAYRGGGYDGVGFVFTEDDEYCGADLDKCRDAATGAIEPKAAAWIERFATYAEVSPRGTGVHLIAIGRVPKGRKTTEGEVYCKGRFFTMTGEHLDGTPATVEPAHDAIEAFWRHLTELQGRKPNGNGAAEHAVDWDEGAAPELIREKLDALLAADAKFRRSWGHDRPDLPDQSLSSYDLSLCSLAARAGWDDGELALLIRAHREQHGSDKWRRADYVQRTIARAREALRAEAASGAPTTGADAAPGQPWPVPLGLAAYHGLAGAVVTALLPQTEADPAALLIQLLAAFGNAVGDGPHFLVEGDRHGTNINAALVGASSKGRKGTSWGRVRSLFERADEAWSREHVASGLSSGEGLIWAVRDPITKRVEIKGEKGKPSRFETQTIDEGVTDKRLLVLESELASTFRVMGRDGNTLSALLRQAWDGGDLRSLTKNSPAKATRPHISLVGHVTVDELRRTLDRTELANGFANRFLFVCTRRSKLLPEGGAVPDADLNPLVERLHGAVVAGRTIRLMRRDDEARALWAEIYAELSEGRPGMLGAIINRAEAQALRLSMIYALLDGSAAIRREHLQAAREVWRYCEDSARYIFGDALGDPVADTIMGALRVAGPAGLTRTQIRDLFDRHQSATAIDRALNDLLAIGRVSATKEATGGRPVTRWIAAP